MADKNYNQMKETLSRQPVRVIFADKLPEKLLSPEFLKEIEELGQLSGPITPGGTAYAPRGWAFLAFGNPYVLGLKGHRHGDPPSGKDQQRMDTKLRNRWPQQTEKGWLFTIGGEKVYHPAPGIVLIEDVPHAGEKRYTRRELHNMPANELRELCREYGLAEDGTRAAMKREILAYYDLQDAGKEPEPAREPDPEGVEFGKAPITGED